MLFPIGFPVAHDGFVALGTPIGLHQFNVTTTLERHLKIKSKVSRFANYGDLQSSILFIRSASSPSYIPQLRSGSFSASIVHVDDFDNHVISSVGDLLHCTLTPQAANQAGLRIVDSGVGITPSAYIAPAAFIAGLARAAQSFHEVFKLTSKGERSFFMNQITSSDTVDGAIPIHSDLMEACKLMSRLTGSPSPNSASAVRVLHKNPRSLQKTLMAKINAHRADVFMGGLLHPIDRARILSSMDHLGNSYLRAIPSEKALIIEPGHMAEALTHRLGLPSALCDFIEERNCKCKLGTPIDCLGYHLRACLLGNAPHISMHNECVGLVAELARSCGFYVSVEPRRAFQTTRERPDLLIHRFHPHSLRPAAIDLTFLSATAASNFGSAALGTGHLSRLREVPKSRKYTWQTDLLNFLFIGAGIEDGGALGSGFKELIAQLCKRGADQSYAQCLNWSAPTPQALFYQKLSCAVQRGFSTQASLTAALIRAHVPSTAPPVLVDSLPFPNIPNPSSLSGRRPASLAVLEKRQAMGERLFPRVAPLCSEGEKITGMLLELPFLTLDELLVDNSKLAAAVMGACSALAEYRISTDVFKDPDPVLPMMETPKTVKFSSLSELVIDEECEVALGEDSR